MPVGNKIPGESAAPVAASPAGPADAAGPADPPPATRASLSHQTGMHTEIFVFTYVLNEYDVASHKLLESM